MSSIVAVEGTSLEPDLSAENRAALREAVRTLERPSFAARMSNAVGKPLELMTIKPKGSSNDDHHDVASF